MKKTYKLILLWPVLNFLMIGAWAQDNEVWEPPSKFYVSPDFGLIIGNTTSIEVTPSFGYHLSKRLSAGLGGRYQYFRQLDPFSRELLINTNIWGIKTFGRLMLIPNLEDVLPFRIPLGLFAHAEVEFLNLENKYYGLNSSLEGRFWQTAVLTGAGISQQTGMRSNINIMILWDLTNSLSSPYINPVIRFGMQFYI